MAATSILLVIPVYNHGATLRDVVTRALAAHPDVLVVDDGSTDAAAVTAALAGRNAALVRHPRNRGKGAAILTAAAVAATRGFTHVVTLDADGQHDPADVPQFVAAVTAAPDAIVIGRRDFAHCPAVPRASRFGRAFGNFWVRVQTGQAVGDVQSGYRAYPVAVLLAVHTWTRRFAFEVEILVRAAWAGVTLRDVDVRVDYAPRGGRVSHFRVWRDNLVLSLLNAHLTLRSIVPWPHRRLTAAGAAERITLLHPLRSLRRLLTAHATPGRLAAAGGLGVFLGTLPLVGVHTVAILFAASYLNVNKPAAVASSQLCMPPLVPALCLEAGYFLRHGAWLTELSWRTLGYQALDRVVDWLLGALVLAPLLGLAFGLATYLTALALRRALDAAR